MAPFTLLSCAVWAEQTLWSSSASSAAEIAAALSWAISGKAMGAVWGGALAFEPVNWVPRGADKRRVLSIGTQFSPLAQSHVGGAWVLDVAQCRRVFGGFTSVRPG